ncbi:MAG: glycosyltransferase family protein [Cytophagaceae bacterium]
MKILYAIQGTGNGHVSRAMDIVPLLKKKVDTDVLISGIQSDIPLPFPVQYRYKGLSFIFGKNGGVDMYQTFLKLKSKRLYDEIKVLPIEKYDLIINDFEPISAWAAYGANKPCISLSHQAAVVSPYAPKPTSMDLVGQSILRWYAPSTNKYGFHFERYDKHTYTPVIRQDVRKAMVSNKGHISVYLPAFEEEKLIKRFQLFDKVQWHVFSKHSKKSYQFKNVSVFPIRNEAFVQSMATSAGVICGAGFETPAEALYLGKKLLAIPMKGQYEQQCNATALSELGVTVIKNLKKNKLDIIDDWLTYGKAIDVDYPDITEKIIDQVLHKHAGLKSTELAKQWDEELNIMF